MIPKIIHYCWLSNDPVPENLKMYMEKWKTKLNDYQFVKWDFTRFEKNSSAWVSEAFDNKKYAFAADYIRLYAVYNYGGIYLDMDMEVIKKFDDFLNRECMLAYERPSCAEIEAGCFGAEKNNAFIGKCLEYYADRHFIKENGSFDTVPLPYIMFEVYKKMGKPYELLSHEFFTAKSYDTGIEKVTDNTYTVHHFAGSWLSKEQQDLISETHRLSQKYGRVLGRNMAQYKNAIKKDGIYGVYSMTLKKICRNIRIRK